MANMHITCVSSVRAHDPLSFTKREFKEKIIKHFEITEQMQVPAKCRALCSCTGCMPMKLSMNLDAALQNPSPCSGQGHVFHEMLQAEIECSSLQRLVYS